LIDASGKTVAVTRSDYDGFFLVERVAYGQYRLRLSVESSKAAGVDPAIDKTVEISAQKSVVRLGVIRVLKTAHIALADTAGAGAETAR
jgi:hypothetical protein